jgi:hypothetical protein
LVHALRWKKTHGVRVSARGRDGGYVEFVRPKCIPALGCSKVQVSPLAQRPCWKKRHTTMIGLASTSSRRWRPPVVYVSEVLKVKRKPFVCLLGCSLMLHGEAAPCRSLWHLLLRTPARAAETPSRLISSANNVQKKCMHVGHIVPFALRALFHSSSLGSDAVLYVAWLHNIGTSSKARVILPAAFFFG